MNIAEPGQFTIQPNLMNDDGLNDRDVGSSNNKSFNQYRS